MESGSVKVHVVINKETEQEHKINERKDPTLMAHQTNH